MKQKILSVTAGAILIFAINCLAFIFASGDVRAMLATILGMMCCIFAVVLHDLYVQIKQQKKGEK